MFGVSGLGGPALPEAPRARWAGADGRAGFSYPGTRRRIRLQPSGGGPTMEPRTAGDARGPDRQDERGIVEAR